MLYRAGPRGPWLVARGPGCAHGETRPVAPAGRQRERKRKRKKGHEIGGVDSAKESEREREKARGWAGRTRSPSSYYFALPPRRSSSEGLLLLPSSTTARSLSFFLFLSAFLSLPRALLCARTHARSCARVVGRVALSPRGWFRDVPPLPRTVDVIKGFPRGAR